MVVDGVEEVQRSGGRGEAGVGEGVEAGGVEDGGERKDTATMQCRGRRGEEG